MKVFLKAMMWSVPLPAILVALLVISWLNPDEIGEIFNWLALPGLFLVMIIHGGQNIHSIDRVQVAVACGLFYYVVSLMT